MREAVSEWDPPYRALPPIVQLNLLPILSLRLWDQEDDEERAGDTDGCEHSVGKAPTQEIDHGFEGLSREEYHYPVEGRHYWGCEAWREKYQ